MMRQTILLMSLFICVFFSVNAQISTDEEPVSFREGNIPSRFSVSQDIRIMPALDMNRIEQEDAKDEANGLPPRFGYPHEVSLDLENSGHWQELSNGDRLWQLTIRCPQALSINLLYDRFWLPEGGKFFIYTADRKHSIGAFTSINNKGGRDNVQGFATGLLYGDEVTLEYYQPKQVTEQAIISVSSVIHGYKYVRIASDKKLTNSNSPVPPGFCFVEISCPEGRDWQKEKNAIAMIVKGERAIGTGALINNTKNNGEPLFLTANHCLDNKYDARGNRAITDWLFYWRYEDPNCKYVSAIKPKFSTSGAEVIANNPESDFALLRLAEDPSRIVGVTPYYLGWDRSGNPGGQGASIHHPFGSTMKISIVKDRPLEVDYKPGNNHVARCWKVNWSKGMIEQGSSGSPLLNAEHRIIGQLYAGTCYCDETYNPRKDAYYGCFHVSWTGKNDPDERRSLKRWLDIANINPQTWNGIGVINTSSSISGPTVVCDQETYTIQNLPSGVSVQWSTSNGNLQLISGQGARTAVFRKNGSGECMIRARIASSTITYRVWAGVPSRVDYIEGMREGSQFKPNSTYVFSIENDPNSDNVTWAVGGGQIESGQGTNRIFVKISDAGRFFIWARKRNRCGTGGGHRFSGTIENSNYFSLSPNPATDVVTLKLTDPDDGILSPQGQGSLTTRGVTSTYEIQLWNGLTMLRSFKTNQLTFQIPIAGLPAGLYFVRVIKDGQTYTEKLIKN